LAAVKVDRLFFVRLVESRLQEGKAPKSDYLDMIDLISLVEPQMAKWEAFSFIVFRMAQYQIEVDDDFENAVAVFFERDRIGTSGGKTNENPGQQIEEK